MSGVVWPSPAPLTSSGSFEVAVTSAIVGLSSQLSTAVTVTATSTMRWFGGQRNAGSMLTVTTGGVSSVTVAVHVAVVVPEGPVHSTVTLLAPRPYGPSGSQLEVAVPPAGSEHVATAAQEMSALQTSAPAEAVGERQFTIGATRHALVQPSVSSASPSSHASPGSRTPLPHARLTVSTAFSSTSERQTGSGLYASTSHSMSWSVEFAPPGAPFSPPGMTSTTCGQPGL